MGSGDFILGSRSVRSGELQCTEPDHVYAYAVPTVEPVKAEPLAGLDELAGDVAAKGITSIQGDVRVNDKLRNPFETKEGVLTSIMVNDNRVDMLVNPGSEGGRSRHHAHDPADGVLRRGMPTVISKFANAGIEPGTVMIYDGEGSDPASAPPRRSSAGSPRSTVSRGPNRSSRASPTSTMTERSWSRAG